MSSPVRDADGSSVKVLSPICVADCESTISGDSKDSREHEAVVSPEFSGGADDRFSPFMSEGIVAPPCDVAGGLNMSGMKSDDSTSVVPGSFESNVERIETQGKPVTILRDTGSSQSILLQGAIDLQQQHFTGQYVLISGISGNTLSIPLYRIVLKSSLLENSPAEVVVGLVPSLPVEGCSFLMGNDLGCSRISTCPIVSEVPVLSVSTTELEERHLDCLPSCVVTRSQALEQNKENDGLTVKVEGKEKAESKSVPSSFELSDTFLAKYWDNSDTQKGSQITGSIREMQRADPELQPLLEQVLDDEESEKVPVCYVEAKGVLARKWRCPWLEANDPEGVVYQVVVPSALREHVLELAHDVPMSGHTGVRKTKARLLQHFWWPSVSKDVSEYVRSCHGCQKIGKPGHQLKQYPLKPIPVLDQLFDEVLVDIVGPLPRTSKGNEYILSILETSSRFPEAVPLRKCTSRAVTDALTKYFTMFGLPKRVRSDQGSHFLAHVFQDSLNSLGVSHVVGCAYHPQTQGAVERFHQTLKSMLKGYVLEHEKEWDVGLPFLMFAARTSVHESLGVTPADLVFGHSPRGPLQLLKDNCLEQRTHKSDVRTYVVNMKARLRKALDLAHSHLGASQRKMKEHYDTKAVKREFAVGDDVLVQLPVQGNALTATLCGPYRVKQKVDNFNYVVLTPDRRKKSQLCHINQLRQYTPRQDLAPRHVPHPDSVTRRLATSTSLPIVQSQSSSRTSNEHAEPVLACQTTGHRVTPETCTREEDFRVVTPPVSLGNSAVLANLNSKLDHLGPEQS